MLRITKPYIIIITYFIKISLTMEHSQEETFFESNFVRGAAATLALAAGLAFVVTKKAKLNNGLVLTLYLTERLHEFFCLSI